jgi:ankyrin repeat protein
VNTHADTYSYPLHWAAHTGDLDVAKALVAKGARLDVVNKKANGRRCVTRLARIAAP